MRAGLRYGIRGEFVSGEPNNVLVKRPVACQAALGGKTNVIQVTTRVSDGLMDVDYQWDRNGACGYAQWRMLAPISSRIRRIQPPLEARVWAKSRAGGRFAGGWRRHRYVGPLVYASQLAP